MELHDLIASVKADDELFGPEGPCPVSFEEGSGGRVLLVTGGNASGKSLVCRYLGLTAATSKVEFMRVGMGLRTQSGIHRAFMFGEEDRDSTGRISGKTVRGGISTCRNRTSPHFLCLDEPDVGLSEEMQDALGQVLAGFGNSLPDLTRGFVVVTHSRAIASRLMELDPHRIRVGAGVASTREWIERGPLPVTADDFEEMDRVGLERFRAVQAVLNERKQGGDSSGPSR